MHGCRKCVAKDHQIRDQRVVIADQTAELRRLRDRILELEESLRQTCEYAEVCRHHPMHAEQSA